MNLVVIDDDKLIAASLKTIIEAGSTGEIKVKGIGYDGVDAIKLYSEENPDILLMDIRMKGMSGIDAAREILKKEPTAKILFLTTFEDDEYIEEALKLGVKGYILKQNFESIIPSLKAVSMGQSVFGQEIISRVPDILTKEGKNKEDGKSYGLTEKEEEIIKYIAKGLSNKEISTEIFLSEGTIRNYISGILEKLQLRDRTQLAIFYFEHLK